MYVFVSTLQHSISSQVSSHSLNVISIGMEPSTNKPFWKQTESPKKNHITKFVLKGVYSKPSGKCIVVPNFCFLS